MRQRQWLRYFFFPNNLLLVYTGIFTYFVWNPPVITFFQKLLQFSLFFAQMIVKHFFTMCWSNYFVVFFNQCECPNPVLKGHSPARLRCFQTKTGLTLTNASPSAGHQGLQESGTDPLVWLRCAESRCRTAGPSRTGFRRPGFISMGF